jgi:hypothetical protein
MVEPQAERPEGDVVADGDRVDGTAGEAPAVGQPPEGRSWSVAGLVLAGLGLAMFPIGGLVSIVCGGIARSKGDRSLGTTTIVFGVISFFASFLVAALVLG